TLANDGVGRHGVVEQLVPSRRDHRGGQFQPVDVVAQQCETHAFSRGSEAQELPNKNLLDTSSFAPPQNALSRSERQQFLLRRSSGTRPSNIRGLAADGPAPLRLAAP